jgi:cytochrome c6
MRPLLFLIALCLALVLGTNRSFAGSSSNGAKVFASNCVYCHAGGDNTMVPERSLMKSALESYLKNYTSAGESAVRYQVTYGSGLMPAFGGKLTEQEIADVAAYVVEQAENDWN